MGCSTPQPVPTTYRFDQMPDPDHTAIALPELSTETCGEIPPESLVATSCAVPQPVPTRCCSDSHQTVPRQQLRCPSHPYPLILALRKCTDSPSREAVRLPNQLPGHIGLTKCCCSDGIQFDARCIQRCPNRPLRSAERWHVPYRWSRQAVRSPNPSPQHIDSTRCRIECRSSETTQRLRSPHCPLTLEALNWFRNCRLQWIALFPNLTQRPRQSRASMATLP